MTLCTICQYPQQPQEVWITTSCAHDYHKTCLEYFLRQAGKVEADCPLCRKNITSELANEGLILTAAEVEAIKNRNLEKASEQAFVVGANSRATEMLVTSMIHMGIEVSANQIEDLVVSSTYQVEQGQMTEAFTKAVENVLSEDQKAGMLANTWSNNEVRENYINSFVGQLLTTANLAPEKAEDLKRHLLGLDQPSMEDIEKEATLFLQEIASQEVYIEALVKGMSEVLTVEELEDLKTHLSHLTQASQEEINAALDAFLA